MKQLGTISVTNKAESSEAVIDIEGIIGIPEWWQFDDDESRISTYDKFKACIDNIRKVSAKKVTVNIRSLGGNVDDALLIHDTLVALNADVVTVSFGYTASAATIIHQAGKMRKISSNSLYLIHQASTWTAGNVNNIRETISMLEKSDDRIAALYAARSGETKEFYEEIMSRANGNGEWLSPDEVLQAKLADEAVKLSAVTNIDMSLISDMKLPDIPENKIIKDEIEENKNDNSKKSEMKIKIQNGWNFMQKLFNWKTDDEVEMTTENLNTLNQKCTDLETDKINLQNEVTNLKNDSAKKDTEIQNLKDKVSNLEGDLAKTKADPTTTDPKEDPDLVDDGKKTTNQTAYEKDVNAFKD